MCLYTVGLFIFFSVCDVYQGLMLLITDPHGITNIIVEKHISFDRYGLTGFYVERRIARHFDTEDSHDHDGIR